MSVEPRGYPRPVDDAAANWYFVAAGGDQACGPGAGLAVTARF